MIEQNRKAPVFEPMPADAASANKSPEFEKKTSFPAAMDYLAFFGIFMLAQLVGAIVGWIGAGWPAYNLLESPDEAIRQATELLVGRFNAYSYLTAMTLTVIGFMVYRRMRGGRNLMPRLSLRGLNPVLLLWGVAFAVSMSVVLEPLLNLLPQVPNMYGRGVWALVTLVVAAPLFEELLFRGMVLESIRAKSGVIAAWVFSSMLFGLVHLHPTVVVNAFFMGLVLAFIYILTESLWAPIIIHALNNGVAYMVLSLSGDVNTSLSGTLGGGKLYWIVYFTAVGIFAVSGYLVFQTLRRIKEKEKNQAKA